MTTRIPRNLATPLTIGAFLVLAVTGVLMFFHLDSALNKAVHEWIGWVMLAGVGLHVAVNVAAFQRYLRMPGPRSLIAGFALVLGLSFVPLAGSGGEPPFVAPLRALAAAPLPVLAQVAGTSLQEMESRLRAAGIEPRVGADSVAALVGGDTRKQVGVLTKVMAQPR
jgi:hypothetical protein